MGFCRQVDRDDRAVIRFALALMSLVATLIAPWAASAKDMTMHDEGLIEFARDFSGNDPVVMDKVKRYVANAPTKIEDVGFYGADGDTPQPERRQWLATVSALADANYLTATEDKYSNELISLWKRDGKVDVAAMPKPASTIWQIIDEFEDDDAENEKSNGKLIWANYAEATQAIEAQLAARGKALLSIDATDGDTIYFAIVDKAVADRWRGTGFGNFAGYDGGIRDPMWDRYWSFLEYAVGPPLIAVRKDYPPGTRLRDASGKLNAYKAP